MSFNKVWVKNRYNFKIIEEQIQKLNLCLKKNNFAVNLNPYILFKKDNFLSF